MVGRPRGRPKKNVPQEEQKVPVGESLAERGPTTDSEVLLSDLTTLFGGPLKLAEVIRNEFLASNPGSTLRQRYLELITRIIVTNTTHEISRVVHPEDMSDEQLEALAEKYTRKVLDARGITSQPEWIRAVVSEVLTKDGKSRGSRFAGGPGSGGTPAGPVRPAESVPDKPIEEFTVRKRPVSFPYGGATGLKPVAASKATAGTRPNDPGAK